MNRAEQWWRHVRVMLALSVFIGWATDIAFTWLGAPQVGMFAWAGVALALLSCYRGQRL